MEARNMRRRLWRRLRSMFVIPVIITIGLLTMAATYQPRFGEFKHEAAPNGVRFPVGCETWPAISVAYHADDGTMQVILANDVALTTIKKGAETPWPDGAIFVRASYKAIKQGAVSAAIVPGDFIALDVMAKDRKKYAVSGGWGFARWSGPAFIPYGKDASFARECFDCHAHPDAQIGSFIKPAGNGDYVLTKPAFLIGQ
ncbi:MAG: cytochrome P460 family protein [Nitrospirae bacterium]|nr:cytochrome P460 family protein [Nitrospirota bacterium]